MEIVTVERERAGRFAGETHRRIRAGAAASHSGSHGGDGKIVAMSEIPPVFQDFKRAMFRCDADALAATVTGDFVWELHAGASPDAPAGRVLRGPDEMAAEFRRRREEWSDVSYDDVEERLAGSDLIVQTFIVSGTDSRGKRFRSHAVDLYPLRDGRVAAKRTFWKIDGPGPAH